MVRKAELEKVKLQLKENFERHHLAVLSVVPADLRDHFMKHCGMMGHGKGMLPMMMLMGHEGMPGMMGMGMMKCGGHGGHWREMKQCGPWHGMMKHGKMGCDPANDEHETEEDESERCCPTCGCPKH
jgi:hypothetical protein